MIAARITQILTLNWKSLLSLGILFAVPTQIFGEALKWSETTRNFETGFYDEEVTATYAFTNDSDQTVTIVESSASCGCTVPSLDKTEYAPGETGELTAIFTIGSRQGKQHKQINIVTETENGDTEEYELTLNVDIPVPVTLEPRVRFWKVTDTPETQTVEVTLHEKRPLAISDLKRRDDEEPRSFDYKIETLEENRHYRIHFTPLAPDAKTRDVFFLFSEDDRQDTLSRYPIYTYIR